MEKAFGYVRKSPDEKNSTESSLNNQISYVKTTCEKEGWELVEVFSDKNISGSDRSRKGFTNMIQKAKSKDNCDVKIIIVKDQDRFARDSAFFSDTLRDLSAYGIKVFSIMKNDFISHEDLSDTIMSVVDQHYITQQRKKTKILYEQKKSQGLPPFIAPYGYSKKKGANWKVSKTQSKVVTQVCEDYLSKKPMYQTLKELKINKHLYYRIIRNAKKGVYCGFIAYTYKIRDSNKNIIRTEDVKYKGKHEEIISNGVMEKFQQI